MLVKTDVFDVKQKVQKGTKRSNSPKTDFVGQTNREGGRADLKNAGVKTFSSFIWTLVVSNKMEKGKGPYRALVPYNFYRALWGPGAHKEGPN